VAARPQVAGGDGWARRHAARFLESGSAHTRTIPAGPPLP